jgi:hypothetical protein
MNEWMNEWLGEGGTSWTDKYECRPVANVTMHCMIAPWLNWLSFASYIQGFPN